jgi:trk system potassium uptake protein TrkH
MIKKRLSATQTIALGFALIIIIGAVLLSFPFASVDGRPTAFINALFTSTSATCVTGLVVFDTGTKFTFLGQLIILFLIQVGGLGFMAVTVLFSFVLKKRIGLRERCFLTEAFSTLQLGGIVKLVRRILLGTLFFEEGGALLLTTRFIPVFGFVRGLWYSIFHSISAFCNAGFDLMGVIEPYSSLTHFKNDPIVNLTVILLIIIGGIGFVVWDDIYLNRFKFSNYNLHSKVILSASITLIFGASLLFFITEENAAMAGMNVFQRILASLFQAVTPRTAGFNTIDLTRLSSGGTLLTIGLMFVGAAPGSTGGGIKVTTFVVMLLGVAAYSKGRDDIEIFKRRIGSNSVWRAFCSALFYFMLALTGAFLISVFSVFSFRDAIFEAFSALGTVGLSMGITSRLNTISKIIIILLMYSGRIGSLTVILSVSETKKKSALHSPVDKVIIG